MNTSCLRSFVRAVVVGALLFLTAHAAQETRKSYNLPAGDAVSTLKQFSEASGRETLFAADAVRGVHTAAIKGEFTPKEALDAMLEGTGLQVVQDEKTGALAVKRDAGPNAERAAQTDSSRPDQGRVEDGKLVLEKLAVTGRRVDGLINKGLLPTDEDAPLHYDVISRQDIERMGATNIEEVFRNVPAITTYSTPNQEASVVQIVGSSSLSSNLRMRGFDANQTTVLINGRRIARSSFPNLVGSSSGDLTRIPVSAIERIEILPSSGSAMYGGGAIGGVINVILRKDYQGRELTFSAGTSTDGGSTTWGVNYLHGFSLFNGRTSGTLTFSYQDRGPLSFAQREGMLHRALSRLSTEAAIGSFTQMPGMIRLSAATGDLGIPGAAGVRYAAVPVGLTGAQANALTPASFTATAGQFTPTFDRYQDNYIYTPSKMFSLGGTAEHQLVKDHLTLYTELSYTRNEQDIHNPKFFGTGTSYTLSATHPFNPFRTNVTPGFVGRSVILNFLPVDLRDSGTEMTRESYRGVVGLKGHFGERWEWSIDGTSEVTVIAGDSQIGADNIILASYFSSTTNPATFAQRWALYNPFIDHNASPAADNLNQDYFNVIGRQRYWQYASNLIARVTGDVADWRAGTIKTSAGVEAYWWQYEGKRPYDMPQPLIDIMGGRDNLSRNIAFTKQGRRTDAVFGELIVPVLSQQWRPLPVESLDLNFSGRYEDANDSKSATTIAAAFRLAVTRDVALRFSRTEGFFPPEQNNLFLSDYAFSTSITNTFTFVDPRRGGLSQVNVPLTNAAGPNPSLRPETSTSDNLGLIFTPRFAKGLRLSLDYWRTEKVDAIRTPTLQQLLDNEGFFPDRVARGANLPGDLPGWAGVVTGVDTRFINFSKIETSGIDAQLTYALPTASFGEFTFRGTGTYTKEFITAITPLTAPVNSVGTTDGGLKWRGSGSVFWNHGSWTAGLTGRYTDSYKTGTTAPSPAFPSATGVDGDHIASDTTWDVQLGYKVSYGRYTAGWRRFFSGTQWTLNVANVFNRMPPWNSSGFYSRYSDPRMRYISLQVKKSL
ncbi:MAG: TonB-dependent receptor plug domain-containing protein [Opitutaceae bacterium]|nr:TonB-dependent receptor plug domain-containing protein [Opitutaceae bacterium]